MSQDHQPTLRETLDGLIFTFEGFYVARVSVDFQTRLLLMKDRIVCEVVIAVPFNFLLDGNSFRIDPEDVSTVAPVLHLRMREVASASASAAGQLRIDFGNNTTLVVDPSEQFESWNLQGVRAEGSDRQLIVLCLPGGEITTY